MPCADCANLADCIEAGHATRRSASCSFTPSRFIERAKPQARHPALRAYDRMARGSYVSPLWPPPGDPRAAHGEGCPSSCPCRRRGLRVVKP